MTPDFCLPFGQVLQPYPRHLQFHVARHDVFGFKTRGRLARKHFSPGAHPAAETPFYIAAASVSARGDAQCVWSHESSISSSYQRKHGSAAQVALRQLRMCSVQVGLCKLLCASALCKCSVQVALRKLLCASDSAQVALRKCCRSCGNVLRVLFLYLKVAIFQPELRECAPRTTFVLKSCDFPAGAAGARSAHYVCT